MSIPCRRREVGHATGRGLLFAAAALLAGCDLPRDPEGTLDRAAGGTLRVGVSMNEPWVEFDGGDDGRPVGVEAELVERFAGELGARVEWVRGSEAELLAEAEKFRVDLVAAGLTDDTLWSDRVGLSRCYVETDDGKKHVLAVAPGENEFLLRLDRFLAREEEAVRKRLLDLRSAGEPDTAEAAP